jgi:ankyrin repeat protein
VELLLAAGVDKNEKGRRTFPLHMACERGHVKIVELLLRAGFKTEVREDYYCTPLHLACGRGHLEVVLQLLAADAKMDAQDEEGGTPLHYACRNGHANIVELLLNAGAKMNVKRGDRNYAELHTASKYGHVQVVRLLLKAGADITLLDAFRYTGLHWACSNGCVEIVELFLKAQVDVKGKSGTQALELACGKGSAGIVKLLLDAGVEVNGEGGENTPLHNACMCGHTGDQEMFFQVCPQGYPDIVELLLNAGAKVNVQGRHGRTALHIACLHGHADITELLLNAGADMGILDTPSEWGNWGDEDNNEGKSVTALHEAARHKHVDVVRLLLTYMEIEKIKSLDLEGFQEEIALIINRLEHAQNVQARFKPSEGSFLEMTTKSMLEENGECPKELEHLKLSYVEINNFKEASHFLKLLEQCHASQFHGLAASPSIKYFDEFNSKTQKKLFIAIEENDLGKVQEAIEEGAIDNEKLSSVGCVALYTACERGCADIASLLLKAGVDVDSLSNRYGYTALHAACVKGHPKVVELLLQAGAKVNVLREDDESAPLLQVACRSGNADVVELLLQAGADVNARAEGDFTALYNACEEGHADVVELLLNAGADMSLQCGYSGETAFHIACQRRRTEIVERFLKADPNIINVLDKSGRKASIDRIDAYL